ncbi:MAG TPA: response regulator [Pedobacter sp.]|jgi:DNA-binding response OmpR family regulator
MKKKILVIEKDVDILHVIEYILKEHDYTVFTAHTEKEIIASIKEITPDAILLDVIKPTDEGTALCNAIKANPEICHIPVIVLSTHFNIQSLKSVCADEIIEKPFDIHELLSVIEKQLQPVSPTA